MKVDFIRSSYKRFYEEHQDEILDAIHGCFKKGSLIAESEVEKFEKNFAKFCKRKYCLTTSSGTDALKLACIGRKPLFVSEYRYRLPIADNDDPDCVVVTYMNSVVSTIGTEEFLIEDACQAAGRELVGDISCFSFYPAKMIGGLGKGGALVTNDKKIYEKLKKIRDDKWNNIWLDEVHAAFLNVKLKYLPELLKKRQKIADYYNENLPQEIIWNKDCLQNYILIVKGRDKFIKYLNSKGIEAITDQSDFYVGNLKDGVRIPIYPEMKPNEVKYVCKKINEYFK